MSQKQIILNFLRENEWVCSSLLYASYIADPRTRLAELRKQGYVMEWRWCKTHTHFRSKEWRMVSWRVLAPKNTTTEQTERKTIGQSPLFAYSRLPQDI